MTVSDPKTDLQASLQHGREALIWKLDGLSEYDIRRPLVRTGTNLLGLIKHQGGVELGYFGDTFSRPAVDGRPWDADIGDFDLFARADESRKDIVERYRGSWAHADETIRSLPLNFLGRVPWWPPETNEVTLHQILVHVTAETARHAGHADIIRELIDGAAGLRATNSNLDARDESEWDDYRTQVERAAQEASNRPLP